DEVQEADHRQEQAAQRGDDREDRAEDAEHTEEDDPATSLPSARPFNSFDATGCAVRPWCLLPFQKPS
ncbi:hypothetical protein, partial [Streptomyces sp. NPDC047123]|uniref:hypothetical protein n=1 Tax=Streptomyces sp. NPDC047123 TaxID=3155622 RepID=UPI0034096AAF